MAIDGECREGRAGIMRGAPIEPPASRVAPFVLVIPNYYSVDGWRERQALLRGLLLEPKLYQPEDPEAGPGQIPMLASRGD